MGNRGQLARRRHQPILANRETYVAALEDVILAKLWYYQEGGSEKHLRDIAAMFRVSGEEIDKAYVDRWAKELGIVQEWQTVLERLGEQ